MKNAISVVLLFIMTSGFAQTSKEKLQKEQQKLEKKISNTKKLLAKVKTNTQASLNEIRLIDNQIKSRESLVRLFDNQVRMADVKMTEKQAEILELEKRLKLLVRQYRKMLLYAYKNRSNHSKAMYILSSGSYNEALQRNRYLKKIAAIQKRQVALINQHQSLIGKELKDISSEKESKLLAMEQKKIERDQIEKDKSLKQQSFEKLKIEEQQLSAQLQEDERKKQDLKRKVDAVIREEINKAKQKEIEREKEKNRKIEAEKNKTANKNSTNNNTNNSANNNAKNTSNDVASTSNKVVYSESSEGSAVGKSFANNKGRLPWPVDNGQITERYGRNAHPTLPGVSTVNNGVDITCSKGSRVRSVFEGEVSSIFSIPGSGKVVIIKHGGYMTVYSNLQDIYVSQGSKVSLKQTIGSLVNDGGVSISHFEVHLISNGVPQTLNPSLWLGGK
ncbi:MAG: murein hydrolase activator EnvC family protein [Crocinitomicaceae bacterium]